MSSFGGFRIHANGVASRTGGWPSLPQAQELSFTYRGHFHEDAKGFDANVPMNPNESDVLHFHA
jgi:hypothetical protein